MLFIFSHWFCTYFATEQKGRKGICDGFLLPEMRKNLWWRGRWCRRPCSFLLLASSAALLCLRSMVVSARISTLNPASLANSASICSSIDSASIWRIRLLLQQAHGDVKRRQRSRRMSSSSPSLEEPLVGLTYHGSWWQDFDCCEYSAVDGVWSVAFGPTCRRDWQESRIRIELWTHKEQPSSTFYKHN